MEKEALGERAACVWVAASAWCHVPSQTWELYSCPEGGTARLVPLAPREGGSLGYWSNSEQIIMMSGCFLMEFRLKYRAQGWSYFVVYAEKDKFCGLC